MGIGKTIMAIGVINYLNLKNILIICPATLKLNWKKELIGYSYNGRDWNISTSGTSLFSGFSLG
jgi:superfamily II DNA or RNA helicase